MSRTKVYTGGLASPEEIAANPVPLYVGIDQSYTGFGLTIMDEGGYFKTLVYQSSLKSIERLVDIRDWLCETLRGYYPGLRAGGSTALESPVLKSPSALISGQLYSTVLLALEQLAAGLDHARPLLVPPTTLKKFVTGSGSAQKSEMLLETYKRWGVSFNDDNAADSYGLAMIARGHAETDYQRKTLQMLEDRKYRQL